jgi:hypothetical protein
MTTIGNQSRPAYVYDSETDTWVPIGVGPHTHDEYIDKTIITTKGDIIVGTATEAVARLGVGAEGSVLLADPTSPTGLAWGEAGGSITVSETAPEGPGEGDLWFNSTNATTYIYYDGFWIEQSPAVAGPRGEPGILVQTVEPAELDALWLDSDETGVEAIPPGGTAGQILTKATNSNYDAQWVNPASYNYIINGGFDIWQRGTSFTTPAASSYTADRTRTNYNGTGSTRIYSRQTFTPGSFSIFGYEPEYFYRFAQTVAGSGGTFNNFYENLIEDVRTLSGQTVTISFWGKADASRTITPSFFRSYGTGGSTAETVVSASAITLTTEWVRYSRTVTIPTVAGKTIGANSSIALVFGASANITQTIDIWGVQVELGSIATRFKYNTNSIQAELAACQRYYYRTGGNTPYDYHGTGSAGTTNSARILVLPKQTMRVAPTSIDFANLGLYDSNSTVAVTSCTFDQSTSNSVALALGVSSGLTQFRPYLLISNNSFSGFIGLSAEL